MKKIILILFLVIAGISVAQTPLSLSRINTIWGNKTVPGGDNLTNTWYTLFYKQDSTAWHMNGNTTYATKSIGTISNQDFKIKTNNVDRFLISKSGYFIFGDSSLYKKNYIRLNSDTMSFVSAGYSHLSRIRADTNKIEVSGNPIQYAGNYSARYTTRSLTDKSYVDSAINYSPAWPKFYKALISQNAPIANTKTPSLVAGQIWELTYTAGAGTQLSYLELISGTLDSVGSKYRMSKDTSLTLDSGDSLKYDGAPYVVSTDSNGDFAPFINTLGGNPSFSYLSITNYTCTLSGVFKKNKTITKVLNGIEGGDTSTSGRVSCITIDDNSFLITAKGGSGISDYENSLYYSPIEIEVYQ